MPADGEKADRPAKSADRTGDEIGLGMTASRLDKGMSGQKGMSGRPSGQSEQAGMTGRGPKRPVSPPPKPSDAKNSAGK